MAVVVVLALAEERSPVVSFVLVAGRVGLVGWTVSVPPGPGCWLGVMCGWFSSLGLDGTEAVRLIK